MSTRGPEEKSVIVNSLSAKSFPLIRIMTWGNDMVIRAFSWRDVCQSELQGKWHWPTRWYSFMCPWSLFAQWIPCLTVWVCVYILVCARGTSHGKSQRCKAAAADGSGSRLKSQQPTSRQPKHKPSSTLEAVCIRQYCWDLMEPYGRVGGSNVRQIRKTCPALSFYTTGVQ